MSVFIPSPGNDFLEWANNLQNAFLAYSVPVATDPLKWRDWVTNLLLNNPSLGNFPLPHESNYPNTEDWKKWAEFFCNNIYTSG